MSGILVISIISINLALLFYSIGVWSERFTKYLKKWHLITFWIGFSFDVTGTLAMHFISDRPFDFTDTHTLTGQIALWLMLAHATWATHVVRKNKTDLRKNFHRYSIFVWLVWLVPYIGGAMLGMHG